MANVPLSLVADLHFTPPTTFEFVDALGWLPIGLGELHLSAYYFALAVRFQGDRPQLGVILDSRYLVRPVVGPKAEWHGGYRPVALRAYPFELGKAATTGDPIQDLEVSLPSATIGPAGSAPLTSAGKASPFVARIQQMLVGIRDSSRVLMPILDRLFMADLMVPLRLPGDTLSNIPFFVVDRMRFARTPPRALRAMARQDFHAVDIAVACVFSSRLLATSLTTGSETESPTAATAPRDYTPFWAGLDEFPNVLDESELFSLEDVGSLHLPVE